MLQDVWLIVVGWSLGLFSSLIGAIVNNYFQRKQNERKRRWELEDKQTEIKNKRIEDAQVLLNSFMYELKSLIVAKHMLIQTQDVKIFQTIIKELPDKMDFSLSQFASSMGLGDFEISKLVIDLQKIFNEELASIVDIMAKIEKGDAIDKVVLFGKLIAFEEQSLSIVSNIQSKLLYLASQ